MYGSSWNVNEHYVPHSAVFCYYRFRLEADPDIDPEPIAEVTLRAKNGIHLKFTRRWALL